VTSEASDNQIEIGVEAPEGNYEVPERGYKLLIHLEDKPDAIEEKGTEISSEASLGAFKENAQNAGWYFDEEAGELYVRLSGNSEEDITVTISK